METFNNLYLGFHVALMPVNLFFCFIGVVIGTLVGVLPGIGPVGAMALLLPATFGVSLDSSLIMLAGIYYGAMYGGSTTSILVNIPGEAASVITCIDGYQMARQGRAGPALGISAIGSFIGGTLSVIGLMFIAKPLANAALRFGPPEYFALMCTGLIILTYLTQGSMIRALMMALVGILLGSIGLDIIMGLPRFTFGINELTDGVGIIPLVMGLFGIAEVFSNIEAVIKREVFKAEIKNIWPSLKDYAQSKWAILRGSVLGFFLGILPGGGAILASFLSYGIEKKLAKEPERFGKGAIEGVAGPETANNAAAGGSMIPLLSLGIPPNVVMAMLFSAFIIHGVTPGPMFMNTSPGIFWGLVVSMYMGNVMLVLLNLPLIGIWVQVLKIPYRILMPLILLFCLIGAYSVTNSTFDVALMIFFGGVGYLMRKFGYEGAPLVLAFVMGPLLEQNLRQSLLISGGSFAIFITRPISGVTLGIAFLLLLSNIFPYIKRRRQEYKKFEE
ncbi:MAG TPA: tripartite tricarboxylate transporter permease [Thermodesulfobacteriota bacterium]|nr:tripartite tricarboxylate transporter permease [Thermodesulfobacteriota bacterium]